MKKQLFCRIAGLLLTLALLLGMLSRLDRLTYRKSFPNTYDGFLPHAQQVDVLLLGDSHVWDGVFPLELWARQGISAYNLGYANAYAGSQYWIARCALEYARPRVILLDCHWINAASTSYLPFYQNALAAFPFSLNKIRAAYDLCPPGSFTAEDRFSLICGFSAYHSRWSELSVDDFTYVEPPWFGARPLTRVDAPDPCFRTEQALRPTGPNVAYLARLAEDCRARGIRLVLTTLPFCADEQEATLANGVAEIAAELEVDYLNLLGELADERTDYADRDSHLNISGACKLSAYLADWLAANCDLPDHRGEAAFSDWEEACALWAEHLDGSLAEETLMIHSLMLLSHQRYAPVLYLAAGSGLFDDALTLAQLRSLCGGAELPGFAQAAEAGESYLLFYDRGSGTVCEAVGSEEFSGTPRGTLRVERENCLARIGEAECSLAAPGREGAGSEALCFVFTADLEPLPSCSHAFNPGELGQYYRSDYPDE